MKMLVERRDLRSVSTLLFVLVLISSTISTQTGSAYQAQIYTDPVSYPLPSLPEPILPGGDLRVEVNAGSDASGWTAKLTSKYGSSTINLGASSYEEEGGWTLFFSIPETVYPELYSLNLAYSEGGDNVNHTQSNSVWVLEEWPDKLTINHISDTHLPYGAEVFAQFTHEVNLVNPDLIIHTGDVVDVETIASAWPYYQGIMNRLKVPCYVLPGNHDYAGANSRLYQKYGGKLNYSLVIGDFLFIAFDSHSGGFIYSDQLEWAERVLQEHPDKVKMVGFHHPLLGSEYEDDEGTVKGGEITGSWENIEELDDLMYDTWRDNLDKARELLRLIETYDIRLIMTGHVHRDMIYILNNKHYFVTTSTTGGSLPPGPQYGSRLIEIDSNGNVQLDEYAEKNLYNPPNSIPTGHIEYYYKTANDGSEEAVSAIVVNGLERQLSDAKLEFLVSDNKPIEDYIFYPSQPNTIETFTSDKGHLFVAYFDVPALSTFNITLAATVDLDEPAIEVEMPLEYEEGMTIQGTFDVADEGWGVREVTASYSTTKGATWTELDLPFTPQISADMYVLEYPSTSFEFTIPEKIEFTELLFRVEAWDFADNHEIKQTSITKSPPNPTYTLTINSAPIKGLTFNINDSNQSTPYSEIFDEGTYTLTLPRNAKISGKDYTFKDWSDGVTSMTRTVELESDTSLTAIYEEVQVEEPEEEPHEEPEPEKKPFGGIPLPTSFVVIGVILAVFVLNALNRRN